MGEMRCPVTGRTSNNSQINEHDNNYWWPDKLNLRLLRQNSNLSKSNGM